MAGSLGFCLATGRLPAWRRPLGQRKLRLNSVRARQTAIAQRIEKMEAESAAVLEQIRSQEIAAAAQKQRIEAAEQQRKAAARCRKGSRGAA